MRRRLPPLNGLRSFEAAARHLSFKRAAGELHVTPAAISQQVKALEDYFDVPLFHRVTRALRLTDAGQAVLPLLTEAFDKLAEADHILRDRRDDASLVVSVPPSFGAKWLVPRLEGFRRAYPDYEIRLDATDRRADFSRENVDVALRYGHGNYPGMAVECVLAESVIPVCAPSLLEGPHPLRAPADLKHHTLIHLHWTGEREAAPNWRMWLQAAGITDLDVERGPRYSMESMAAQAALDGQGVALVSSALVVDDIARGSLVRPFPDTSGPRNVFCYYLVCPPRNLERPMVAAFRDWVMAEASKSASGS